MGNISQHPNMVTLIRKTPQLNLGKNTKISEHEYKVFLLLVNWRLHIFVTKKQQLKKYISDSVVNTYNHRQQIVLSILALH
jgi:hypothetical protein